MHKQLAAAAMLAAFATGTAFADTTAADPSATPAADAPVSAPAPAPLSTLPTKTGLHLALTGGLSFGGDTLAEVTYTNGDNEKLSAGGLFYFAGGPSIEFANSPWSVQALFGRHINSVTADNADLSFKRNTMELQVFHRFNAHRLGLGYVKHGSAQYEQSGAIVTPLTVDFKDATGVSLEYNYLPVGSHFGLSLRAVKIDYETDTVNGIPVMPETFSGNHIAAGIYVYL